MKRHFTLSPADRITSSRKVDGIKHAFIDVLRAVYIQPCIDIPPKPSRACMGFCDTLTGIKKALASRQEMPPKLALSPKECQNPPYYLADYRIKGSEKKQVCVSFPKNSEKSRDRGGFQPGPAKIF
jgi:hypothetical protein